MISDEELAARECLKLGSILVHPKYLPPGSMERFRERCRECWRKHGKHYPDWVLALIEEWKKEAKRDAK
jgi:hypothetical protein